MRIIGFTLKKVLIERKNPPKGKTEIKSNINIDNIEKEEVDISERPSLKFDFTFSVNYEPEVASVEIKGSVIALDEKGESKEILKEWKKKRFESNLKTGLFNFILDKCNLKAIQLEEELGLPFHIPFPKLTPAPVQEKEKTSPKYAG